MLKEEAIWIGNVLASKFAIQNFPLLNIGSSTAEFREETQAHIHDLVFKPLQTKDLKVIHTDIKEAKGVDAVGDLNNPLFRISLKKMGIKSVLCSNLLEHLENPKEICCSILDLLSSGDLILVTVPYYYPFHKDPIDTMLRPGIRELHSFFPGTEVLEAKIVEEQMCFKRILFQNRKYLIVMSMRVLLPFYKFSEWKKIIYDVFHWNKNFTATCLLLKKV